MPGAVIVRSVDAPAPASCWSICAASTFRTRDDYTVIAYGSHVDEEARSRRSPPGAPARCDRRCSGAPPSCSPTTSPSCLIAHLSDILASVADVEGWMTDDQPDVYDRL